MILFLSTVKFASIDAMTEKQTTATNVILSDAVSFSDAENTIYEQMQETEFTINSIKKFKVNEIIEDETKAFFFDVRLTFIEADEKGKEYKVNETVLVQADTTEDANNIIIAKLSDSIINFEIRKITKTNINSYIKSKASYTEI